MKRRIVLLVGLLGLGFVLVTGAGCAAFCCGKVTYFPGHDAEAHGFRIADKKF